MRLPSIVGGGVAFTPNRRVDVYHRAEERAGRAPLRVAEVFTDGVQGRVKVLDSRFSGIVEPLFCEALLEIVNGGTSGSMSFDGEPVKMRAWKPETIEHIVAHTLVRFDLRAEIVSC